MTSNKLSFWASVFSSVKRYRNPYLLMCILTEIMYVIFTTVLSWESAYLVFCTGKSRSVQYNRISIWDDESEVETLFRIHKWGSLGFNWKLFQGREASVSTYNAVLNFTFTILSVCVLLLPLCLNMMMMMIKASWDIPIYKQSKLVQERRGKISEGRWIWTRP